ncbi:MAG: gliding motility-associated C-terminal domain-containing protein [Bacteroidales bacterium]|nr:gliding motility-associated C-terminal domain-containing protein [Bacteroidales bacterium]
MFIILGTVYGHGQNLPFACAGSIEAYGITGSYNSTFEWLIDGGIILDNSNDSIVVQWDTDRRNHRLQVVEITDYNCIGNPVEAYVDVRRPDVNLGADFNEICADGNFEFDASGSSTQPVTYLWQDGSDNPTYVTNQSEGVWVRVTDIDGCVDYDSSQLVVHPLPVVDLGPDTTVCGTGLYELNAGYFSFYDWSTGDIGNPIQIGSSQGTVDTISVVVMDDNGCIAQDTILMLPCDLELLFAEMPNTITPNGDGQNDEWIIPYMNLFPNAELEIFDRWGRLIYRSTNISGQPWDGHTQAGKELPMDSYYYVIKLNVDNFDTLVGTVNIIR